MPSAEGEAATEAKTEEKVADVEMTDKSGNDASAAKAGDEDTSRPLSAEEQAKVNGHKELTAGNIKTAAASAIAAAAVKAKVSDTILEAYISSFSLY